MNNLTRTCPKCNREITYSTKYSANAAKQRNTPCNRCCQKIYDAPKLCIDCGTPILRVSTRCKSCNKKGSRNWVIKNGGLKLATIAKLKIICGGKNHSNYHKRLSVETKAKIANSHRKENLTYEQIVNYRKGAVKRIERQRKLSGGKLGKNYNINACQFFNRLNSIRGWDGQHALNKGERAIYELGYFLDYYEPSQNIVIEWDENYHRKEKQKLRDELKQKEVTELLKCKFYRIKEYDMDFDLLQTVKSNGNYNIEDIIKISP